jgi:hypothetical protein
MITPFAPCIVFCVTRNCHIFPVLHAGPTEEVEAIE